ncbi:hypothetical protein X975_26970, partial [Stegodyphus mimosarum]
TGLQLYKHCHVKLQSGLIYKKLDHLVSEYLLQMGMKWCYIKLLMIW